MNDPETPPAAGDLDEDRLVFRTKSSGRIHLIEHYKSCDYRAGIEAVKRTTVKKVFRDDPVCEKCWKREQQNATRVNKRIADFVKV